jgi:SAM-dependent methyltransferase
LSGFSSDWLRLREPADHRARDHGLMQQLARHVAGHERLRLVDLGCGTGSNLRAVAPKLRAPQSWRLIDYDPALLSAAREEIAGWQSERPAADLDIAYDTADLNRDLETVLAADCDIVTASALFDLVSERWLERFAALLARRRPAFYTVLIFDGLMRWQPAHPADAAIGAAFCAHQQTDKGFGAAAGPDAGRILVERLSEAGYRVTTAPSPWRLGRSDQALITATAMGIADAAAETGRVAEADLASWRATREVVEACEIGHLDLLALPD